MAKHDERKDIKDALELMDFMRSEKGCPWDRKQTIDSLEKTFREESGEVLEAIEKEDYDNLREELGDVLWNIIFISHIANEKGLFSFGDVASEMQAKIIRRHPHVFGDENADDEDQAMEIWQEMKRKEKVNE